MDASTVVQVKFTPMKFSNHYCVCIVRVAVTVEAKQYWSLGCRNYTAVQLWYNGHTESAQVRLSGW